VTDDTLREAAEAAVVAVIPGALAFEGSAVVSAAEDALRPYFARHDAELAQFDALAEGLEGLMAQWDGGLRLTDHLALRGTDDLMDATCAQLGECSDSLRAVLAKHTDTEGA